MTNLFSRANLTTKKKTPYESLVSYFNPTQQTPSWSSTPTQSLFSSRQQTSVVPQTYSPKTNLTGQLSSQPGQATPTWANTTPKPVQKTQPVANPMDSYTKTIDDYFKRMSEQSGQRVAQEEASRQKQQELTAQRYGLMNDSIRSSVPVLNNNFNTFKTNTQADVADTVAQGETQKAQVRDYYGEAQRNAAQARNETQQQATQKFASQGAVDSAGAGSYRQANENIDSDFNRYVQTNSKEMAIKLTDIDTAVGQYQRQASTLIQTEEAKLQESLRQIEYTLADNEIAKSQAIEQVYQQYQDRINGIQDTLSGIEQQAITQKQSIQMELDKLAKTKFTPEFMATGVPTNQAEYEFMVTNADKMKELGILPGGSQASTNQNKALTMVNRILDGDTNAITGAMRSGGIPILSTKLGSVGKQTDYDGLKSLLALAERGQLKGSGTVSDFEAKMLEKAAMAGLNQNLPDEEFRRRLQILQQDLMSGGATSNMSSNMSSNIITAPDGQQIMIVD